MTNRKPYFNRCVLLFKYLVYRYKHLKNPLLWVEVFTIPYYAVKMHPTAFLIIEERIGDTNAD